MDTLQALTQAALEAIALAREPKELEQLRVQFLGKKGSFTEQLKTLGGLPADQRPAAGAAINTAKDKVNAALTARKEALDAAEAETKLAAEMLDITRPR